MEKEKLDKIRADHLLWLRSEGGARADLSGADLSLARLRGADLRGADLAKAENKPFYCAVIPATINAMREVIKEAK